MRSAHNDVSGFTFATAGITYAVLLAFVHHCTFTFFKHGAYMFFYQLKPYLPRLTFKKVLVELGAKRSVNLFKLFK